MALNAGLRFATPEEHFLGNPVPYPNPPTSFRPDLEERELLLIGQKADSSTSSNAGEQADFERSARDRCLRWPTVSFRARCRPDSQCIGEDVFLPPLFRQPRAREPGHTRDTGQMLESSEGAPAREASCCHRQHEPRREDA